MLTSEYEKIETVLISFLEKPRPKYEMFFMMGRAYQNLGRLNKAVEVFEKAISHFGLNTNVLNALGECYFQLGNSQEALAAWEKSLEIDSSQPQIKKNVEALKGKK